MSRKAWIYIFSFLILPIMSEAQNAKKDYLVTIHTDSGDINLVLFDDTPKHKENFIKLVEDGFYDSCGFHRIIRDFMIQGGDPNSKPGGDESQIGRGGPGYTLEAEIIDAHTHEKGALCAARLGDAVNPEKRSSGSQFYIVHNAANCRHLNGAYTVYGKVIGGMEVIDKIANVEVERRTNKPVDPIRFTMEGKWTKKKKITKEFGYEYAE